MGRFTSCNTNFSYQEHSLQYMLRMEIPMSIPFPALVLSALFAASTVFAQQKACPVDLPVGIVDPNGTLLNGLTASDITVRLRKQALPIETIGYDTGPRRIVFVLDTSRRLPPEARKAETMLVNYVVSNARSFDSFALLTARGPLRQVRFEDGREALSKALEELASDPKEQTKAPNVLDTVMAGIGWFGEPRLGDAIFIMADHLEETNDSNQYQSFQLGHTGPLQGVATDRGPSFEAPSHLKFSAVMEALADHRIRVFGLQLGSLKLTPLTAVYSPNNENLFGITKGSGGYAVLDPSDSFGSYLMSDARAQSLQHKVFQIYGAITQFYQVRVNPQTLPRREPWNLELVKDLQKNTVALFPRLFDPCRRWEPVPEK
jgi:hypothetical protein